MAIRFSWVGLPNAPSFVIALCSRYGGRSLLFPQIYHPRKVDPTRERGGRTRLTRSTIEYGSCTIKSRFRIEKIRLSSTSGSVHGFSGVCKEFFLFHTFTVVV